MSDTLLRAIEETRATTICYTGPRQSGKTVHATLMAIALCEEGYFVGVLDLSPDGFFATFCEGLESQYMKIRGDSVDFGWLSRFCSMFDFIVIDMPLTATRPYELQRDALPKKNDTTE